MAGQKDIHNTMLQTTLFIDPIISTNTISLSKIIDTVKFSGNEFLIIATAITDGTYVISVQEGDEVDDEATPTVITDGATVETEDLLVTLSNLTFTVAETASTSRVGYIGSKRWLRLEIESTDVSTGGIFSTVSIQGNPKRAETEDNFS